MKIYRFEVKKEVGGVSGNLEYEAVDEFDGADVTLLQWTPANGIPEDARDKMAAIVEGMPGIEVFSKDSSFYLRTTTNDAGKEALRQLRSAGFFVARWPGFDVPVSLPPGLDIPKEEQPVRARQATPRKWKPIGAIAAILLAISGLAWVENRRAAEERAKAEKQHQLEERVRLAEEQAQKERQERLLAESEKRRKEAEAAERQKEMEARLQQKEAQRKRDAEFARQQLELQRQRDADQARQQREAQQKKLEESIRAAVERQRAKDLANAANTSEKTPAPPPTVSDSNSFSQRQQILAAGLSREYYQIRLVNCSAGAINVAIYFQDLDGQWVTEGWWRLEGNQSIIAHPAYSRNSIYYFYAEGSGITWPGNGPRDLDFQVERDSFLHLGGHSLGSDPAGGKQSFGSRIVKGLRIDYPAGFGEQIKRFGCQ